MGLADERPAGVDAFVRWQEAGLPDVLERTGLSPRVGERLLWDVCGRAAGLPLSVRLSPNQSAAPDLVDTVLSALDETALPPARLEVAMPAAEVFDGRARSVDNLSSLASAGVGTAVHDFGGGPAAVVRLGGLPLRAVALTARLVSQARGSSRKSLLGRALSNLAVMVHESGATVAVDDVRSRREAEWWRHAGADTASGPLFSADGDDPAELSER